MGLASPYLNCIKAILVVVNAVKVTVFSVRGICYYVSM